MDAQSAAAAATGMPQAPMGGGGYQSPGASGMYPPQGPPQQWNTFPGPGPAGAGPASAQQQGGGVPANNAPPFFPAHPGQAGGPRFPAERPGTQSRQALSNMLRQRHPGATQQQHPGNQFIPGNAQAGPGAVQAGVPVGAGGPPAVVGGPGMMGNNRAGPAGGPVGVVPGQQQPPYPNQMSLVVG